MTCCLHIGHFIFEWNILEVKCLQYWIIQLALKKSYGFSFAFPFQILRYIYIYIYKEKRIYLAKWTIYLLFSVCYWVIKLIYYEIITVIFFQSHSNDFNYKNSWSNKVLQLFHLKSESRLQLYAVNDFLFDQLFFK